MTPMSSHDPDAPVTMRDLEEWSGRFENELQGRLLRWAIGVIGSSLVLALGLVWRASDWKAGVDEDRRDDRARIEAIDQNGTRGLQGLQRQVDSLRWEMRALPNLVASEVELRLRRRLDR